jgi:hypothetical protein
MAIQTLTEARQEAAQHIAPISTKQLEESASELDFGMGTFFPEMPTHAVRVAVLEDALPDLLEKINDDENAVRVFVDSRIESTTVCLSTPYAWVLTSSGCCG